MKYRFMVFMFLPGFLWHSQAFARLLFFTESALKETHQAIVQMFINESVSSDPILLDLANKKQEKLWKEVIHIPDIQSMLLIFSHLNLLSSSFLSSYYQNHISKDLDSQDSLKTARKRIRDFLKSIKAQGPFIGFADLSSSEKRHLLSIMVQSPANFYRQLGFALKTFYAAKVYEGELVNYLSEITPKGDEIAENLPPTPNLVTHLTYHKGKLRGELDYIIVGSGAAASVMASELQKVGKKVLVLEKGSFFMPGAINSTDNFQFLHNKGLKAANNGGMFFLNGETVGGGISVNIDMSYPPTLPYIRHKITSWHNQGLIPKDLWTQNDIERAYSWVEKTFEPRIVDPSELNPNNDVLRLGATNLGIPFKWYELNTYAPGHSPYTVTSKKSNVERLLLPAMIDSNNPLTLLPDCEVDHIIIKDNKARGVAFYVRNSLKKKGIIEDPYGLAIPKDTKIKVKAKHVIVAAGNLGSSTILLRSKVDNPNIGRGFVSHPFIIVMGKFEKIIDAHQGTPSTVFIDHFLTENSEEPKDNFLIESAAGNPSAGAVLVPGTPKQILANVKSLRHAAGVGVILVEDVNPNNRIVLDKKGRPQIFYALSENDKLRFAKGVATAVRMLFAAGAKKVAFNTYEPILGKKQGDFYHYFKSAEQADLIEKNLKFVPNQNLIMGAHMIAGNKIGLDKATSVINPSHEVWDVKNLYVVDGSVFPSSIGANPMQSIYTIAKLFVERHLLHTSSH